MASRLGPRVVILIVILVVVVVVLWRTGAVRLLSGGDAGSPRPPTSVETPGQAGGPKETAGGPSPKAPATPSPAPKKTVAPTLADLRDQVGKAVADVKAARAAMAEVRDQVGKAAESAETVGAASLWAIVVACVALALAATALVLQHVSRVRGRPPPAGRQEEVERADPWLDGLQREVWTGLQSTTRMLQKRIDEAWDRGRQSVAGELLPEVLGGRSLAGLLREAVEEDQRLSPYVRPEATTVDHDLRKALVDVRSVFRQVQDHLERAQAELPVVAAYGGGEQSRPKLVVPGQYADPARFAELVEEIVGDLDRKGRPANAVVVAARAHARAASEVARQKAAYQRVMGLLVGDAETAREACAAAYQDWLRQYVALGLDRARDAAQMLHSLAGRPGLPDGLGPREAAGRLEEAVVSVESEAGLERVPDGQVVGRPHQDWNMDYEIADYDREGGGSPGDITKVRTAAYRLQGRPFRKGTVNVVASAG